MTRLTYIIPLCTILLALQINCEKCTTSAITGISCPSSTTIVEKYKIPTNRLQDKLRIIQQQIGERIKLTKDLIAKNVADSQKMTTNQLTSTKKLLLQAKDEVKTSPIPVQMCVNKQNLELAKILPNSQYKCNSESNFERCKEVRSDLLKLQQLLQGFNDKCVFLNPLRQNYKNLDLCISTTLKQIEFDLVELQKNLDLALKDAINQSVRCCLQESNDINERIGLVLGTVRNCKNTPIE